MSLSSIRNFFDKYKKLISSESYRNVTFSGEIEAALLSDLVTDTISIEKKAKGFVKQISLTLTFPAKEGTLKASISTSLTHISAEVDLPDELNFLRGFDHVPSVRMLLDISDSGVKINPVSFVSQVGKDAKQFSKQGFQWSSVIIISKSPLETAGDDFSISIGVNAEPFIFTSLDGVEAFLRSSDAEVLFKRAIDGCGSTIVYVGGLNGTLTGSHLIITELWENREDLEEALTRLETLNTLKSKQAFLQRAASAGIGPAPVVPNFFNLDLHTENLDLNMLVELIETRSVFCSLLALSSHAVQTDNTNQWILKLVERKTIQSTVEISDGNLVIDGTRYVGKLSDFREFASWSIDEEDSAKLSIARRTATLHSSSLKDMIQDSKMIRLSAEAAHDLYISQQVKEVMDTRQRFTEYLVDWNNRDVRTRLDLGNVLNLTALGGFAVLLSSIIRVLSQPVDSAGLRLFLIMSPVAFLFYLIVMMTRIHQISNAFNAYLENHLRQIRYYQRILGEAAVSEIAGPVTKALIETNFNETKRRYQILIAVVGIIALVLWLLYLAAIWASPL